MVRDMPCFQWYVPAATSPIRVCFLIKTYMCQTYQNYIQALAIMNMYIIIRIQDVKGPFLQLQGRSFIGIQYSELHVQTFCSRERDKSLSLSQRAACYY